MADRRGEVDNNLRTATNLLSATSDTPRLDAELLMAHALGIDRQALLLDSSRYEVPESFVQLVARRMGNEPIAYIVGYRDFWTIRVEVGPGVLIPRPDSETLIEVAIDIARERGAGWPRAILDLGTGPGTLLLAALDVFRGATGLGVDASPAALAVAQGNWRKVHPLLWIVAALFVVYFAKQPIEGLFGIR